MMDFGEAECMKGRRNWMNDEGRDRKPVLQDTRETLMLNPWKWKWCNACENEQDVYYLSAQLKRKKKKNDSTGYTQLFLKEEHIGIQFIWDWASPWGSGMCVITYMWCSIPVILQVLNQALALFHLYICSFYFMRWVIYYSISSYIYQDISWTSRSQTIMSIRTIWRAC